jgi:TolB-like protein
MSGQPGRSTRFWQELKRRNVIRSLAIYAGSAFVILEAATIIFPRWGFPDWTIDLVLYLLIFGALVNLVISWFFDLTSSGVQKTKPMEEETRGETAATSRSWKLATYASLVVIVGLIIWHVVPGEKLGRKVPIDSLVILPFDNFTGDEQMESIIAGMHSMLIGDIGRIKGLRVISPTTSRVFKKGERSVPEIASDLGVNAVIEPSVMCFGDTVCLQVKVMSTYPQERMLWVADFREPKSEVLNLYNRITEELAEKVRIELTEGEKEILTENRTVRPEALEAFLKAQYYWELLDMDSIPKAMANFQLAAELDPEWADPYAGLGLVWSMFSFFGALPHSTTQPMIDQYLTKAMELNPNSAQAHFVKAVYEVWNNLNWEQGEASFLKSMELNPNDALTRLYYAHLLLILRRNEEAIQMADIGLALDPMKPLVLGLYGVVMAGTGKNIDAIQACEKAVSIDPRFRFAHSNILFPAYQMGDYEKWMQAWTEKVMWSDQAKASVRAAFDEGGPEAAIEEMFRLNELYYPGDCFMSDGIKAVRYMHLGKREKALDHFEMMIEADPLEGAYLGTDLNFFNQLKDNPRYIAMLKKLNLPTASTN